MVKKKVDQFTSSSVGVMNSPVEGTTRPVRVSSCSWVYASLSMYMLHYNIHFNPHFTPFFSFHSHARYERCPLTTNKRKKSIYSSECF